MNDVLGLPLDASAHGSRIDTMIGVVHWLMLVLFVIWSIYFVYVLFRFRRVRNPKADYVGVKSHASSYLEIAVAAFEGVLLIGFAIPVWSTVVNAFPSEKDATVVRIVAEQFAWNVHYPGLDGVFGRTDIKLISAENPLGIDREDPNAKDDIATINQLNLPVNKPVIIHLTTKDVIHSLNLPLFRVKQDAIPGQNIPVWFKPVMTTEEIAKKLTKAYRIDGGKYSRELQHFVAKADYNDREGNSIVSAGMPIMEDVIPQLLQAGITEVLAGPDVPTEIACAQLCGLGHYRMRGFMKIQTDEEYRAWLAEEASYLTQ